MLALTAAAAPEGDADDAITAAWKAAGGEDSVLGAKQGDVYAVGNGFAQNFAGGKVFFTPATGARAMYGAVLDKYESLGGPGGSDLGFPLINEVPDLAGPDSRVSTFSAPDKPVIFWTPDHGAFVVRGAMKAAWDKLGSSGGVLGVPVGDETYDGELATQPFSSGKVSWNRVTKTFTTVPPELAGRLTGLQVPSRSHRGHQHGLAGGWRRRRPAGRQAGRKYPVGPDGIAQDFAGGKVFFSPATGANAVEGDILAKYESLGGPPCSDLGFPTANEADGSITPASRISTFSVPGKPVIFWTPDHGAFVMRGAMKAAWDKLGGPTGKLGAPVGDQAVDRKVVTQKFTGGKISWNAAKNTFTTQPSNLASSLSGLQVPGQNRPSGTASTASSKGFSWHWWWLLVAIPLLLLVGMVAAVALWWHRRRALAREIEASAADRDVDVGYHAAADEHWSPEAGSGFGSVPMPPRYSESQRPATMGAPDQPAHGGSWMQGGAAGLAEGTSIGGAHAVDAVSNAGEGLDVEDPDAVDTAPTRVPSATELSTSRHAAVDTPAEPGPQSDAAQPGPPVQLAIHLPLDDPYQEPDGYPVKADTSSGLYYTPESELYDETLAEIWLASEEVARANGFIRAG